MPLAIRELSAAASADLDLWAELSHALFPEESLADLPPASSR